ncbi:MAG: ISL3 family transposase, partial [Chloroflexota bacterium]|nr:ISL3 family transposase [Chloroflexota bacterium]
MWFEQQLELIEGVRSDDGEILNLAGWRTVGYKETDHDVIIFAALTTGLVVPCGCGTAASRFHKWGFPKMSCFHDLPIRQKRTRVYFQKQRYHCPGCGKTAQQPMAGLEEGRSITARLAEYIRREGLSIFRTVSDIADEVGYGEQSVRNLLTEHAVRLEKLRRIEPPVWLAVDEVYIANKAHCVITDPRRRRVLDLLPGNDRMILGKWLLHLPDRHAVQVVTMDFWPPYFSVIRQVLPGAEVVIDRFHVHNLLNHALKGVLQAARDGMTYSEQRKHMRDPLLLLTSRFHLRGEPERGKTLSQQETVDRWLAEVPILSAAYWLKEDFSDILQLGDRRKAEDLTDRWLARVYDFVEAFGATSWDKCEGRKQCPFSNIPTTINKWRPSVLNYIDYKKRLNLKAGNSFAEHVNGKIKAAKALSHNCSYETIRVKLVHGGVMVSRRPPHPLDRQQKRSASKAVIRPIDSREETDRAANLDRLTKAREDQDRTKG